MPIKISKKLIIDQSGYDPYQWSISNNWIATTDLNEFFDCQHITPILSEDAIEEFNFNYDTQENLFSGSADDSICFSEISGSLTSCQLSPCGTKVNVEASTQDKSPQCTLYESSAYWNFLSEEDKSIVCLQRQLSSDSVNYVGSLVNDWRLKEQIKFEGYNSYGSASMLCGIVLSGVFVWQKACKMFYKWKNIDPKWTPLSLTFKEVLEIEKQRVQDGSSFWIS